MNSENIGKIRAAAVLARVKKSADLGSLATWSVDDHRRFMAKVLLTAVEDIKKDECVHDEEDELIVVLKQIDNHSAMQQSLERQYGSTGHFVRKAKNAVSMEEMMAALEKEAQG
jgi:hypothetical protein